MLRCYSGKIEAVKGKQLYRNSLDWAAARSLEVPDFHTPVEADFHTPEDCMDLDHSVVEVGSSYLLAHVLGQTPDLVHGLANDPNLIHDRFLDPASSLGVAGGNSSEETPCWRILDSRRQTHYGMDLGSPESEHTEELQVPASSQSSMGSSSS